MNWQQILPYVAPVLVIALLVWRFAKAKPTPVKPARMWIRPTILAVMTGLVVGTTGVPPLLVLLAVLGAGVAGALAGWFMGRAVHMSVHPETGIAESRATPIAAALIVGIFLLRYAMRFFYPQMNIHAGGVLPPGVAWVTDGVLLFSTALVAAQALTLWLRARPLIAAHAAAKATGTDSPA